MAGHSAGIPRREGVITVGLVVLCQSFQALTIGGIALFLPLIREDLQITFSQAGLLSACSTLTYALGQIPAGFLSDRFGPRRLFFIGILGATLLSLSFGLIHSFEIALLNQVLSGVFRALLFAPGLALLSSWFPPNRQATAIGLYVAGGFSGNIFLSLVGPLLVVQYGWRPPFIGFAVAGIAAALLYYTFGKEKPRSAARQRVGMLDAFQLFKYPIMWVCGGIQFVRLGVVIGYNYWLPSFLVSDRGFSIQTAGLIAALGAACTVPANALGGYLSDRLRNPPLIIGSCLAVLAVTSSSLVLVQSMPALLLVVAVHSLAMQFYFGPLFLVPIEVLGQRVSGMSTGFGNLFANLGALFSVFILGIVKDRVGTFTWGFVGIGAACLIGLLLTTVLARMRKQVITAGEHPEHP